MQHIKLLQQFLNESKGDTFFIEVSVRDARKAQDIYQDQFRRYKTIDPTSTNSYEITDEDDAIDFLMAFNDQGIEISDTNISA